MNRLWLCLCLGLMALSATGCRDAIFYEQPKMTTLRAYPLLDSGQLTRLPPAQTVAQEDAIHADDVRLTGYAGQSATTTLPIPLTRPLLERGQERYEINCLPCHGIVGDGNGMVAQRGFPHPPTYHQDRLRKAPVGHIFDVITHGFGRMPPYGNRIAPDDRWAIAAYVRVLQRSQDAHQSDVPANLQGVLK